MAVQVIVSHSQLFQESLQGAGLNVTSLTITGPVPQPDETVADQIACLLGPPSLWEQVRQVAISPAFMSGLVGHQSHLD